MLVSTLLTRLLVGGANVTCYPKMCGAAVVEEGKTRRGAAVIATCDTFSSYQTCVKSRLTTVGAVGALQDTHTSTSASI